MKIQRIDDENNLPSFGNYSNDIFMDSYLWHFISKVKALGIKYRDPYFPQLHMDDCLKRMKQSLEERGPLPENWP